MKRLFFIFAAIVVCAGCAKEEWEGYDNETIVRFDDPVFEAQCLSDFDKDGDGVLRVKDLSFVKELIVDTREVRSLGGIEYFVNLEWLDCYPFAETDPGVLERLDVSRNQSLIWLRCVRNPLKRLDVSQNKSLEHLWCWQNQLEELIMSNNPKLVVIECGNNKLSRLDIRHCSEEILQCICLGNLPGLRLDMTWRQVPVLKTDLVCDIRIEGNRIISFADPAFEQELLTSTSQEYYDGLDYDGDARISLHEAASVMTRTFSCDGVTSLSDMRYMYRLGRCTLQVDNREACPLRKIDGLSENKNLFELSVLNLPVTSINMACLPILRRLRLENTDIESLDISSCTTLEDLYCLNSPALKEVWVGRGQEDRMRLIMLDAHTVIKYKDR